MGYRQTLVVAMAVVGGVLVPDIAGAGDQNPHSVKVRDDKGDVVDCETSDPAKTKANDIELVKIDGNGVITVTMRRSVERSLKDQFSFAVVITLEYPDGRTRLFRVQVHDGLVEIGELDPDTRAPLPEGAAIDVKRDRVRVSTNGSVPAGTTVFVEAFNLPESTDMTTCDDASLEVEDQLRPKRSFEPPPPEPSREGPVEDLEEIIQ